MVVTSRLQSNDGLFVSIDNLFEVLKSIKVQTKSIFLNNFKLFVNNNIIELAFRNINTNKELKNIVFNGKILIIFLSHKSNLKFDISLISKLTNRNFWNGRQTTFEALKFKLNEDLCYIFNTNIFNIYYII